MFMTSVRHIKLDVDDVHKLKKYGRLRVDRYVITVSDVVAPQVKVFGKRYGDLL